jgi:hypothetical protein
MRFNQSFQIICITLLVLSQISRSQQMQHLHFGDAHTKDVSFFNLVQISPPSSMRYLPHLQSMQLFKARPLL